MSFINIMMAICCVMFSVVLSNVHCDAAVNGKTYIIRSSMESVYLKTLGDGKVCQYLSRIIATRRGDTDPFTNEYKWLVEESVFNNKFQLINKGPDDGYTKNEITFGDHPLFCFLLPRYLEFLPDASNTTYQIVNLDDGRCLSYHGYENTIIFWHTCGGSGIEQGWIFQETTP